MYVYVVYSAYALCVCSVFGVRVIYVVCVYKCMCVCARVVVCLV